MRQIRSVVVVDNGSTDGTAQAAQDAGAIVVRESKIGYGAACKRAIAHLDSLPTSPDVVVFFPADGSCDPTEIPAIIEPLSSDNAELVLGVAGQPRRMKAPTRVALKMVGVLYRYRFEDFGAFRAIRFPALIALGMTDPGDGWNIEMQLKSVKLGLTIVEVPVSHREAPHSRRDRFRRARKSVGTAGRMLFQILRHSTAR
jgi:glycosyltransferase involved in cell wall biosynthesis